MTRYDKANWVAGNWNAYVAAGRSKEDRHSRLDEVPERLRASVQRHVETVFRLAKRGKVG